MKLVVTDPEGVHLATFHKQDGSVILMGRSWMEGPARKWAKDGFSEREDLEEPVRHTPPDHPQFLERLRDFLARSFDFRLELA